MTFGTFKLKPKPEHLEGVLNVLAQKNFASPHIIAKESGLSLTAVKCALAQLEQEDQLIIKHQLTSPKLQVALKDKSSDVNISTTSDSE
ncbi:hypothetical protein [Herpetosiphon gulosus]|uniref:Uncharacterized protein n=1 Tax=Herpetosiphon gulosus TaxID=1973496 RepID=A0ABP9X0F8_9CHLR